MFKKVLFILLLLILPLSLISCGTNGVKNNFTGNWEGSKKEVASFEKDGSFTAPAYWDDGSYVVDGDYLIISSESGDSRRYKYEIETDQKKPKNYILRLYNEDGTRAYEFKRNKNFIEYGLILLPQMLKSSLVTLQLFLLTLLFSLPLGLPFALGGNSKILPLRWICKTYVWLFRGTPLLLQLFFFYFFLPIAFDIRFSAFTTTVITFSLNYAAYFAEIYRAGIESIDRGQREAARSLGVSKTRTMFDIILPQTIKRILPPVTNESITLIKDTALAFTISVAELMKAARTPVNRDGDATAFAIAAAIYLVFTFVLTVLSRRLETRFSRHLAKGE